MSRLGTRLLLACVLIAVGVFLGIEMTKSGIERIYGALDHEIEEQPIVQNDATVESSTNNISTQVSSEKRTAYDDPVSTETVEETAIPVQTSANPSAPVVSDKLIHKAADTTGQMLQTTVRGGVDLVVSIFEKLLD